MATKRFYWLKLKTDFFSSKEVKKLRRTGGDTCALIYLKMQLMSLQDEGRLFYDGIEESFAEELALELDEDPEQVAATLAILERCGLVEMGEHELTLSQVPELIGTETDSAERKRTSRGQNADIGGQTVENVRHTADKSVKMSATQRTNDANCPPSSGQCHREKEIDIDIDKEKEKEKEKEKAPKAPKRKAPEAARDPFGPLLDPVEQSSPELADALREFVKMRKAIKAPLTYRGLQMIIAKAYALADDYPTRAAIVNQSIANSWKGLFPLHEEQAARPAESAGSDKLESFYSIGAEWAAKGGDDG